MSDETGFLTSTDRAFLRGEKEYEAKQSRYQRREAIAGRARAAFEDFALMLDVMDGNERNRIFDVEPPGGSPIPTQGLFRDLIDTVAFLYLGLEGELHSPVTAKRGFSVPFERVIRAGIRAGERRRYDRRVLVDVGGLEVDVTTNVDAHMVDAGIDKIARQSYTDLTYSEMFAVLERYDVIHGDESYSRLADRVEERREELGIDVGERFDVRDLVAENESDSERDDRARDRDGS